ncbi:MAG TPA: hypothetical protein RMH99_14310 [Sandaracinaceae bacterium LLY-WYZ-13_1]|nr:hypothetical protein [Sandaracinaceae bacterium LLY-WYZ-13_1]
MSRGALAVLLVAGLALGCDDDPPAPPQDAGGRRDAGGDGMDAGDATDGGSSGTDGGDEGDAGGDDPDAARPDGGGPDAAASLDADVSRPDGALMEPDTGPGPDWCTMLSGGTSCSGPGDCGDGQACVDDGCGGMVCLPGGAPCGDAADCPSGSSCDAGACTRGGGCADSRDCPQGFSCDAGSCVDRRIGCEPAPCPHGYLCETSLAGFAPYCFRANQPCDTSAGCLFGAQCRDVAGDGTLICHWSSGPNCRNNADCPVDGEVCGTPPVLIEADCAPHGPCASDADCAAGYECLDLWGDGVRLCEESGGSCAAQTDCPAGALCASPASGGPPRCISRPR